MKQETKYYQKVEDRQPTQNCLTVAWHKEFGVMSVWWVEDEKVWEDADEYQYGAREIEWWIEEYDLPESIEKLKLEWQQHNRDNGLSWNEVAELVNQVAMLKPEKDYKERYQEIVNSEWFQKAHKEMSIGEVMGLPQKPLNPLVKTKGKWPGDESYEELIALQKPEITEDELNNIIQPHAITLEHGEKAVKEIIEYLKGE